MKQFLFNLLCFLSPPRHFFTKFYYFHKKNVRFHKRTYISQSFFEGNNVINNDVTFIHSHLGIGSYIGRDSYIYNTKIGRFCSIAPNLYICVGKHPTYPFVSTHPAFYSLQKQAGFSFVDHQLFDEYQYIDKENKISVEIGNDVWVGFGVTILEGITIGDGAIIASGSVVTQNIPPFTVAGGVPAKILKDRFDENDKLLLQSFKWWDKEFSWLQENANSFLDISKFIEIAVQRESNIL